MIHCAAYTAVDAEEADEAGAFHVNATATRQVAAACQKIGAQLVYPSADYVFAGDADRPLQPVDPAAPLNVYGRSKRAGEHSALAADGALVVRTSWLYGRGGPNFVDTITRRARKVGHLVVVDDQIGRPTWTATLAWAMAELIEQATGIFHATGGGDPVSWYGFARRVLDVQALMASLRSVPSSMFSRPALRPAYSVLDCTQTKAAIGQPLPDWNHSLEQYLRGARV
ncbi:dTDP-4-dehydrorhamnose reductase [soil metagenome]